MQVSELVGQAYDCYKLEESYARALDAGCIIHGGDLSDGRTDYQGRLTKALGLCSNYGDIEAVERILTASRDMRLGDFSEKVLVIWSGLMEDRKYIIPSKDRKFVN